VLKFTILTILIFIVFTLYPGHPTTEVRPRVQRSVLSDEPGGSPLSHRNRVKVLWELLLTKVRRAFKAGSTTTSKTRAPVQESSIPSPSSHDSHSTVPRKESVGADIDINDIVSDAITFDSTSSIEEQSTSISSEYGRVRAYWFSNLENKAAAAAVDPNSLVTVSRNVASPVRFGASQVARRASDKQESDLRGSSSQYSKRRVDYVLTIPSNSHGLVTHDNNVHGLNFNTSLMRIFRHTATTPAELNKIPPTETVSMERHATLKGFTNDLASVSLEASRLNILVLQRSNKSSFVNPDLDENMTNESHYKLFSTVSNSSRKFEYLFSFKRLES
ncbi:unnamed protein product, partial [Ixodes persulcatus]